MLHYLRTFLFSLALVLSMAQAPAATMGQTGSHRMTNHVSFGCMDSQSMVHMALSDKVHDMSLAEDSECTGSTSCVHCATNMACMSHCAAFVAVPAFSIYRLPESLSDQYASSVLSIHAFFFNKPNTPPPKVISFS